jgi:RNA polymerase sigma-70 factor (ECF subfamily)
MRGAMRGHRIMRAADALEGTDAMPKRSVGGANEAGGHGTRIVPAGRSDRERDLVEKLRAGDAQSFATLVREYGPAVLAVTRRVLRNEDDARDAFQDAFVQVLRGIRAFRGDSSLSTWLHRIAWNAALLKIRRAGRRPEVSIEALLPGYDETGHRLQTAPEIDADPLSLLEQQELRERVRGAIARLPLRYRSILILRDLEEKTTRETASLLGISDGAVKVRLHRARKALATLLGQS